jgi:hypothetical protein
MISLAVLLAICSGLAVGQSLPDNPAPAPLPDPAWSRLQNLVNGQPIVVTDIQGRSVRCLFAGVTDAYLFCDPPGNPPGARYRFDHADVLAVDRDLPTPQWTAAPRERNYHPAWISSMIAGGVIVGLCATRSTDAGTAAKAGLIGAGIVGVIGAPLAFMPHAQLAFGGPMYPQYGVGIRLKSTRLPSIFGLHALR